MATKTLLKIESLTAQIEKLNQERAHLTESLTVEITKLLNQKNALTHDFETLVGGILSVIEIIKKEDEVSKAQKQNWKKSGKGYLTTNKKGKTSPAVKTA